MSTLEQLWDGKTSGQKFRKTRWLEGQWFSPVFADASSRAWGLTEADLGSYWDMSASTSWEAYAEPTKLVTWYKPRTVWAKGNNTPTWSVQAAWARDKSDFLEHSYTVLTWEEEQFPTTYEEAKACCKI